MHVVVLLQEGTSASVHCEGLLYTNLILTDVMDYMACSIALATRLICMGIKFSVRM